MEQPTLVTARLMLRPFAMADALAVQRLAGAPEVADTTLNIPHPYPDGAAEQWIATHAGRFESGEAVAYAIVLRDAAQLCGAISLHITPRFQHAEMGYWMGVPYWNHGYTTEAAAALLAYGFETLNLHRIFARHLTRNPASGRVMQKIGMTFEGIQREHVLNNGRFEDLAGYGILRGEWKGRD
ncbi:MAG: GNAT family N-acetyltransferase [Chloroflexi bacterium]|nr:GNAT family N-acetyltransferase [Chloroflexota bacterium]